MSLPPRPTPTDQTATGLAYALAAYAAWGVVPVVWKQLGHVPPIELVSHRVFWSLLFVLALIAAKGRFGELRAVLADPKRRRWMLASTALISTNWFVFIWAVAAGRIAHASLGYYLNPLLNVLLGRLLLGEKLRRPQVVAVALAAGGVVNLAVAAGELPWVSIVLALSFSAYGLVRKQAPVEPLAGLAVETGLVAPVAVGVLAWSASAGTWAFETSTPGQLAWLLSAGAVTALPLLWFAHGARRLKYSTMGIVQYLAPPVQLALAVLVYGEPFTRAHAVTFGCIWAAVAIYAADAAWAQARVMRLAAAARRAA
jgi:chloramphenicol-sensitive protein RarD